VRVERLCWKITKLIFPPKAKGCEIFLLFGNGTLFLHTALTSALNLTLQQVGDTFKSVIGREK
jgi:hypothetical protein